MSMSISPAAIVVVESRYDGMTCDAYPNRLAAVLAIIDNGGLGGGCGYGCDEHKAALLRVEQQLTETRAAIKAQDEREAVLDTEPRQPPCMQCGAMTAEEAETKCAGGSVDDCHGNRLWGE